MSRSSRRRRKQANLKVSKVRQDLSMAIRRANEAERRASSAERRIGEARAERNEAEKKLASVEECAGFRTSVEQMSPFRHGDSVYAMQVCIDLRAIRFGLMAVNRFDRPLTYILRREAELLVDRLVREAEQKILAENPSFA